MRGIRLRAPGLILGTLFLVASAAHAASGVDFGVRAGGYVEDSDPFVGLELLTELGSTGWYFNPNVEFVFAGDNDKIAASFDFHRDLAVESNAFQYLWVGGGPAVIDTDRPRGHDTNLGFDLLGGIGWSGQGTTPYAQLKVVVADDSEVVAGVGIRF